MLIRKQTCKQKDEIKKVFLSLIFCEGVFKQKDRPFVNMISGSRFPEFKSHHHHLKNYRIWQVLCELSSSGFYYKMRIIVFVS